MKEKTVDFLKGMLSVETSMKTNDFFEGQLLSKTSERMRNEVVLRVGSRSFTPEDILKEIENDGEYGAMFVKMITDHRVELQKRMGKH